MKGIKLDFKNIDVVEDSLKDLQSLRSQLEFPVWLNADILPGPGSDSQGVNGSQFLSLCHTYFPQLTLSLGWTTRLDPGSTGLKYSEESIKQMVSILRSWILSAESEKNITFAVRGAVAANSLTEFIHLLKLIGKSSTLTIWSHSQDIVDYDKIAAFIMAIGKDRIYLDVPPEQEKEIRSRI